MIAVATHLMSVFTSYIYYIFFNLTGKEKQPYPKNYDSFCSYLHYIPVQVHFRVDYAQNQLVATTNL